MRQKARLYVTRDPGVTLLHILNAVAWGLNAVLWFYGKNFLVGCLSVTFTAVAVILIAKESS